ncbi:hypothetical protein A3715_19340 [Oleiphilus sp. HI0009]|nr:hypothetical protein A3715_19340 [Oleiphilus sp. HI0009]
MTNFKLTIEVGILGSAITSISAEKETTVLEPFISSLSPEEDLLSVISKEGTSKWIKKSLKKELNKGSYIISGTMDLEKKNNLLTIKYENVKIKEVKSKLLEQTKSSENYLASVWYLLKNIDVKYLADDIHSVYKNIRSETKQRLEAQ